MVAFSVLGMFAAFGIGGCVMAALIQQKRFPTWLAIALSPIACAGAYVLMLGMPFVGWAGEALVVFVAGLAVGFPMLAFFRVGNVLKEKKTAPRLAVVAMGLFLPLFPLTLFTLLSRLNAATWLDWKCDGRILEVTRAKSNHQAPTALLDGVRVRMVPRQVVWWNEPK